MDRSVDVVFGNIEKRAAKARDAISRLFGGSGNAKSFGGVANEAAKAFGNTEKAAERSARARVRIDERANREIVRAFQRASADLEREEAKRSRATEREVSKQQRIREKFADRTSHRATRFLFPPPSGILGAGRRVGSDLLRGAGVDFSLQTGVQRSVDLSTSAINLANQERIATGSTKGAGYYERLARSSADATFSDPGANLALASRFAARTGSYGNLESITPQLASMAKASGADFDQVGSAAGAVFQQVKDVTQTLEVMRAVIGQSAEGAVDMPDYAKQLGRIAAGGFKFEGDRGTNIAKLSALTQIGMERGATSAADAARGTKSFVSTLGKGARLAEFDAAGVRTYADDTVGKDGKVKPGVVRNTLRDPFEIIKDSFRVTGGDIPKMGKMFMDVLGRQGVESLGAVYQGAGGGESGLQAIQGEFDRYMRATMTKGVEGQNMKDIANSPAAKAQIFQNNLDKITASLADRVLPALEELAPLTLQIAKVFSGAIEFAAKFPSAALAIGAFAAVLRAATESIFRAKIEKAIMGAPTGALPGASGAVVTGGAAGAGMQALRALSGAAGGALLGGAIGEVGGDSMGGSLVGGSLGALASGGKFGAGLGAALGVGAAVDQNEKLKTQSAGMGIFDLIGGSLMGKGGFFTQVDDEMNRKAKADAAQRALSPEADAKLNGKKPTNLDPNELGAAVANGIGTKTLNVRIVNPSDIKVPGAPKVDGAGRDKPAGARP